MKLSADQARSRRIGLLVPAGNRTVEPDFGTAFLPHTSVHVQRVTATQRHDHESESAMDDINSTLKAAGGVLGQAQVNLAVYGFTTASFYRDVSYAEKLQRGIAQSVGAEAIVPSLAMLEALQVFRPKRISIVTPYPEWNNEVLSKFMAETPYEVASLVGDARPVEQAKKSYLWHQLPSEALCFILEHARRDVDLVLCPCTAWRTFEIVATLERELGLPVVTANQACIWSAARRLGITLDLPTGGSLFKHR